MKDDNLVQFKFEYRKNAKFDDELLRAEYILPHIAIQVVWSAPPANQSVKKLDKWIPHTKVTEAVYTQGTQVYTCKWHYEHKFHPIINTTLNGQEVATPAMVLHDWFGVLKKPQSTSFVNENPLHSFRSVKTNILTRFLGFNTRWHPISTSRARTHLWKSWKEGKELDACTARWLDEWSLRKDKDLKPYWNARDMSRLDAGENYLNSRADTIMARVDIDPEISSWTPLAFKISDLVSFGTGGDARINTRTQEAQMQDTDTELHILAMDTGTWPNEGGGVSACRRDMVNNLDSIRWHILAENANDFGVPKFQIEKNVQSLTVLPLWGMDFLTPTHGIFQNCLDSSIQHKIHNLRDDDIKKRFLPILRTLVRGSRAINIDRQLIEDSTKALVDLNTYFESSRHWGEVWKSDIVRQAWRELWLTEDMPNCRPISQWLDAEIPTLLHLDNALDMWHRYLFIFSIPVPEKIPDVLASTLILHHADVVLPCADFFNPGWEVEIGTQENTIEHRKSFARKIDPVVNGICNMESFQPIEKIKSKVPTVVMLSHVRFVKDIKTAILAADMIVNIWGFTDYQLHIYGDMEKAPAYSVECQEIIAAKSLRDNVVLKGLGSPSKVLEDAWLFLNSSVSEGLPLAMGEAALTGVPVVCTDVVTDPVTWDRFSAVVAPNDAVSLARAQVNVLALLDEWSKYADDPPDFNPKLSLTPTAEEVAIIQKRMYEKQEQRRRLGMMGRDNVLNSFSEGRYLREHEQMLI
ncbi:putative Exopolysaccharide phosphotransferase [Glarea lozoyensis 74030]|uniref:Putative Exopolysaccharide phosphotransferase n=1 Tax=Glarea lozoyensis (strain ATCC 74030 / MF5533) TaxID=1104152 RepID=H0EXH0_GLAL7|nr:putative Exopolysaccharide phosphotransferase [Glarea lozoyensis 74030]